jgi:hypothetical protein
MRSCSGTARRGAALLLLTLGAGCRSWQPVLPPLAGAPSRPTRVRVTRADGSRVELVGASVRGDTLYGERRGGAAPGRGAVAAVPLDSVRRLEARGVSGARTGTLAAGVLLGLAAVVYLFAYTVGGVY